MVDQPKEDQDAQGTTGHVPVGSARLLSFSERWAAQAQSDSRVLVQAGSHSHEPDSRVQDHGRSLRSELAHEAVPRELRGLSRGAAFDLWGDA